MKHAEVPPKTVALRRLGADERPSFDLMCSRNSTLQRFRAPSVRQNQRFTMRNQAKIATP
jgi:hypothetical protein